MESSAITNTAAAGHDEPGAAPWVTVCNQQELLENVGACALVGGKQVALFRLTGSDRIYAIANFDPFSQANVLSRGVVGDLRGHRVVASPIYKQHFDLETGCCLEDESVTLEVFATRLVDGMVQVENPER